MIAQAADPSASPATPVQVRTVLPLVCGFMLVQSIEPAVNATPYRDGEVHAVNSSQISSLPR